MEKGLYYIWGDMSNPEGVKDALKQKYPDALGWDDFSYDDRTVCYFVSNNKVVMTTQDWIDYKVLAEYGTVLTPSMPWVKKGGLKIDKTIKANSVKMYQPVQITAGGAYMISRLYSSVEELMQAERPINPSVDNFKLGYIEIDVHYEKV